MCAARLCTGQQSLSLLSTAFYCQTASESTDPIDHPDKVSTGYSHTDKTHIQQVHRHGYRAALQRRSCHSPLTWPHECEFVFRLLWFIFTWRRTNSGKQAASSSKAEQKGRVPASAVFTWESICFESLKSTKDKGITGGCSERKTRNEAERNCALAGASLHLDAYLKHYLCNKCIIHISNNVLSVVMESILNMGSVN